MKIRLKMLCVGVLILSTFALARAKSYDVSFSEPMKAGNVTIDPGQYRLMIEGSNAIFGNTRDGKAFTVPVKMESSNTKFAYPAWQTLDQGGAKILESMDLGGTTTKLEFAH